MGPRDEIVSRLARKRGRASISFHAVFRFAAGIDPFQSPLNKLPSAVQFPKTVKRPKAGDSPTLGAAGGVPVGYLLFEGEQHGFRRAETIKRALDAELYFYALLVLRSGRRF